MLGGWELGHVDAGFSENRLRGALLDPIYRAHQTNRVTKRLWTDLLDPPTHLVDRPVEVIELLEHQLQQISMVTPHDAFECLMQLGNLCAQAAASQFGQLGGIIFAALERISKSLLEAATKEFEPILKKSLAG